MAIGCTSGMLFTYIANSSFIFIELFGVPVALFGFLFATNSIGLYIGGQSNRWLLRRFTSEQLLRKGMGVNVCAAPVAGRLRPDRIGRFPAFFRRPVPMRHHLGSDSPQRHRHGDAALCRRGRHRFRPAGHLQFIFGATGGALAGVFHDGTALPMALQIACYGLAARGILLLTPKKQFSPCNGLPTAWS